MKFLQCLRQFASRQIKTGDSIKVTRTITHHDLDEFTRLTGDHNPIHQLTPDNPRPLVHGAFLNSIVAGIIGTKLPGQGTIVVSQNFTFPQKCYTDVDIEILVELVDVRKLINVKYQCEQNGNVVFQGEAKLLISK